MEYHLQEVYWISGLARRLATGIDDALTGAARLRVRPASSRVYTPLFSATCSSSKVAVLRYHYFG